MGKFVVWMDDFSVGNSTVDDQHKELFDLVNKMWHSCKDSDKKKNQLFKKIVEKLRKHCEDEECILARNGCPDLAAHRHEHRKLIRQTKELLDSCDKGNKKMWFDMMAFLLHELLMSHLLEADKKCRKYLHE